MAMAEDRIAVIIGVGQVLDRPANLDDALDTLGLMMEALREAERDAGVPVLDRLDWLAVMDQISLPDPDIHETLAARLYPKPEVMLSPDKCGDRPILLVSEAANRIARGEALYAAVVGGDAIRTANKRVQAVMAADPNGSKPDLLNDSASKDALPHAAPYGLFLPLQIYPLYEQGTRAAWGMSFDEAAAETGTIWSNNSKVAAANPHAWLRVEKEPRDIIEVTADNRMISFPYTKLMVANNGVNMGAALILTSLANARALGVPEERIVYVGKSALAFEPDDYLRRENFSDSPSLAVALEKTLELNGVAPADLDHVELYSCYPCIPKMARRILGLPADRPLSVYGGLTFGGAPVANPIMHGLTAMVDALRADHDDAKGLVYGNGGYATHNHAILFSRRPGPGADKPCDYDLQAAAEARRGPIPDFLEHYAGPGTIESYVMPYGRGGDPIFATVVGRTLAGERFLAHVPADDGALLDFLAGAEGEPVGTAGMAVRMDDGRQRWTR